MAAENELYAFSAEALMANVRASITQQVEILNQNLKIIYDAACRQWRADVEHGINDGANPPVPPAGYVVGANPEGWAYVEQGTEPVAQRPAPVVRKTARADIPLSAVSSMSAPLGDVCPVGTIITAPDGSKWRKTESATPFGLARYYARISEAAS